MTKESNPKSSGEQQLYCPKQAETLLKYLDFEPAWFIDCGPASGAEFQVIKEKYPDVQLLGLEPSPVGYAAAKPRFEGILLQQAAWENDGMLMLYSPDKLLHSAVFPHSHRGGAWGEPLEVVCRSIDSLDEEYGPFINGVLWLDTERSEIHILTGAAKTLHRGAIRAINIEVHDEWEDKIAQMLKAHGFTLAEKYLPRTEIAVHEEIWLLGGHKR